MSPEVAKSEPYNEKVDMYSFGIILYEMTTGVTPFKGMKRSQFIEHVVLGGQRPPIDIGTYDVFVISRLFYIMKDTHGIYMFI